MTWFWAVLAILSASFGGWSFWDRGRLSRENGRLGSEIRLAKSRIRHLERQNRSLSAAPLNAAGSVAVLRSLPNGPDDAA